MCDVNGDLIKSQDTEASLTLARSERKRQRAFLKKHISIGIDANKNYRKRKHRKRLLNYVNQPQTDLDLQQRIHSRSIKRIKRHSITDIKHNGTVIEDDSKQKHHKVRNTFYVLDLDVEEVVRL
jgi:hypothetical protein